MSAVRAPGKTSAEAAAPDGRPRRDRWPLAVAGVLAVALLLRLWGVKQGLPFAYNADENAHFVPKAIGFFGHSYNPQYFINPPGYTYLLHVVFAVWFGGRDGVSHAYATDPTAVFVVARVTAGIVGTVAVWLLYLAGSRLFDRRVGLLAAALLAVAFLPVFYSHLALNDVPALAPAALSLLGTAGVLRRGRPIDYLIAGAGLGLACATKYTAGIVALPLLAAIAIRLVDDVAGRRRTLVGIGLVGAVAVAAFLIANPYALLDYDTFRDGLDRQSSAAGDDAAGKLGLTQENGILYYLWTLTWGLGWIPALAALGGGVWLWRADRRLAIVLTPAPVLFIVFMGGQERFFGRWLLPIFPIVSLLAAYGGATVARAIAARRPRLAGIAVAGVCAALLGQAVVYSVHNDRLLARDDTRGLTRAWMVEHIPAGTKIVVEPVAPDQWAQDPGHPLPVTPGGNRWIKFRTSRSQVNNDGTIRRGKGRVVNVEDYERTTRPQLIRAYEAGRYCWVISGSTQSGRAFAEPGEVPRAIAYYRELGRRARVVYRSSPYDEGEGPVKFNFDWSFDYYPMAYHRPGPEMTVYRLTGGRCGA